MAKHEFTVPSSLSAEDAFQRLADLTSVGEWDHGVSNAQQVEGEEPALHAKYRVTVTGFDGKPTDLVYEITRFDPPTSFEMVGQNDALRAHDTMSFVTSDTGCVLSYVGTLELLGDNPPVTGPQLDAIFNSVASVAERGLTQFLNPTSS